MSTNCEYVFQARQYYDFEHPHTDDEESSYFDEDHEIENSNSNGILGENGNANYSNEEEEFFSPMKSSGPGTLLKSQLRKSSSMSNLLETLKNNQTKELSANLNKMKISQSTSNTALNKLGPKHRSLSKDSLNRLAQPKSNSQGNLNKDKYVSLAEAVTKFQHGTPVRFRSKPTIMPALMPLELTKAQTPRLQTKNRTRPVYAISQEEQEKIEFEKAKAFKIRANPVNKKALRAPVKPEAARKPTTVPQPFNLSKPTKKEMPEEEKYVFHAKPVPKSIKNPFTVKTEEKVITVPETPNFVKRHKQDSAKKGTTPTKAPNRVASSPKPFKPTRTQPIPFSFEKRDELIQKRKEELIKKTLEEEKKAREFHAKPVPKSIINSRANSFSSEQSKSKSETSHNDEETHVFKARPPTVLYKKPFVPKREHHHVEIEEFNFNCDRRLEERKEFDMKIKEAEELQKRIKEEREKEEMRRAEEERAMLRRMAEFNAQPIRKYKQLHIEPSNKVTDPKSPKFHTAQRIKNKENVQCN